MENSRVSENGRHNEEEPPPTPDEFPGGFRYTAFILRLVWVVVVVPFIAGAALAFVLSLPERPSTPDALPERTERTLPTTTPEKTNPQGRL